MEAKKYEVEMMKEGANRYFEKKEYDQAINIYGQAIEKDPENAILYANRAIGMNLKRLIHSSYMYNNSKHQ